jgi:tripartite-type tricarboxylate transporter receptor subunit TctC
LRLLAQAGATRQDEAPEVPTFRELGIDVIGSASRGIVGPPNMPAPIATRLEAAFRDALGTEEFKREAARQAMPLRVLVGAEYRAYAQAVDDRVKALWQVRPWRAG